MALTKEDKETLIAISISAYYTDRDPLTLFEEAVTDHIASLEEEQEIGNDDEKASKIVESIEKEAIDFLESHINQIYLAVEQMEAIKNITAKFLSE